MKWCIIFLSAFFLILGDRPGARADESTLCVAKDAKFVLRLDVQAFRATALGGKVFDIARRQALQEFSGSAHDKKADLGKIHEMLGFDPLKEIKAIVVSASSYDRPEQSILVSIHLGKSTGNLEGLILALPGYASEEYGKYTIHTAAPDDGTHVFGAIHTDAQGDKTVLLAPERESIRKLLDQLDGKLLEDGSFKTIRLSSDEKSIVAIEVLELPDEVLKDGRHAGAVKVLRNLSLRITEAKDDVLIAISLAAGTEQQAEQLRQMAQGLIAMIEFAQSVNPDDQDLKTVQQLVHDVKVARDGSIAKVSITVPAAELSKIIDEQLGDH